MANFKVGRVIHFYDKIEVAVIELCSNLSIGDVIRFQRGGEDLFEQKVDSLQIDYKKVNVAKTGDIIGIKTKNPIKEGAEVFKIE